MYYPLVFMLGVVFGTLSLAVLVTNSDAWVSINDVRLCADDQKACAAKSPELYKVIYGRAGDAQ